MATFTLVTASSEVLQRMPCIWYPVQFQNNKVQTLINSDSKVNVITPAYTTKLGLNIQKTNIRAQKIDGLPIEIYSMVSASLSLQNSLERVWFFEKTFLLADTSIELILRISFLSFSNIDIEFIKLEKLTWRLYTIAEALHTTTWVELIKNSEFAKGASDRNFETFVIYIAILKILVAMPIYLSKAFQIQDDPTWATLLWDKAPSEVPTKYFDYADVFSIDLAMELLENTSINEYIIELIEGKQQLYGPIYTLSLVKLESLKAYIKTYLKTRFIRFSKSFVGVRIIFDKKPNNNFYLCIDV